MSFPFKYIFACIGLILFQVLALNNVNINGLIVPHVYVLFLLILPFQTPSWGLLLLGAFVGLSVDLFSGTPGMHMAASVLVAGVRPFVVNLIVEKDSERNHAPSLGMHGYRWILFYLTITTLIHHMAYFFIEAGTLTHFYQTIARILFSTVFSIFIMLLFLVLFQSGKKQ